jgi:hypothetical protein
MTPKVSFLSAGPAIKELVAEALPTCAAGRAGLRMTPPPAARSLAGRIALDRSCVAVPIAPQIPPRRAMRQPPTSSPPPKPWLVMRFPMMIRTTPGSNPRMAETIVLLI